MGQRSQIYVRYEGQLLIARYYQWNYAERMISRARYGMEYLKQYVGNYLYVFKDAGWIHKLIRIFDTNFDMKDVQISSDIFTEYEDYAPDYDFAKYCFRDQDNNDGKLLVDIKDGKIKYAFLEQDANVEHIMSAQDYMDWDDKSFWNRQGEFWDDARQTCKANIAAIAETAARMTRAEVENFMQTEDYYGRPQPF